MDATGTGATTRSYTPMATDAGYYLRATVTYTDAGGAGKTAEGMATGRVTVDPLVTEFGGADGRIELDDVHSAINRFLDDEEDVTLADVLAVINHYLDS